MPSRQPDGRQSISVADWIDCVQNTGFVPSKSALEKTTQPKSACSQLLLEGGREGRGFFGVADLGRGPLRGGERPSERGEWIGEVRIVSW